MFEDPFPKPSYLFAIVCGVLASHESSHKRVGRSDLPFSQTIPLSCILQPDGRPVKLILWSEPHESTRLHWAMESLKEAMIWDEKVFGLVYDLDLFNVVAVSTFNAGAMENKSLNIFNSSLLLASKDSSTDSDYLNIMRVVGHEYFHNWTGNRVTCRCDIINSHCHSIMYINGRYQ